MYFFVISVPVRAKKIFYKNFCKKGSQKYTPPLLYSEGKNISEYDKKCRIYMIYYNRKEKIV